jgi:hypothetical protein
MNLWFLFNRISVLFHFNFKILASIEYYFKSGRLNWMLHSDEGTLIMIKDTFYIILLKFWQLNWSRSTHMYETWLKSDNYFTNFLWGSIIAIFLCWVFWWQRCLNIMFMVFYFYFVNRKFDLFVRLKPLFYYYLVIHFKWSYINCVFLLFTILSFW